MSRVYKNVLALLFVVIICSSICSVYDSARKFTGHIGNLKNPDYYNSIIDKITKEYSDGKRISDIMKKYDCEILLAEENIISGIQNSKGSRAIYYYFNYGIVVDFTPEGQGRKGILCFDLDSNDFTISALEYRDRGIVSQVIATIIGWGVFLIIYIVFKTDEYKSENLWKKTLYK